MTIRSVILAAGQGTRMHSALPKVLHPLLGKPLVWYTLEAAWKATSTLPTIVVGHSAQEVIARLGDRAQYVLQEPQKGTGHAVLQTKPVLIGKSDHILVTYADMPLVKAETLEFLIALQKSHAGPMSIITVIGEDPRGFGRVVRDAQGNVCEIVEEAQATPEQLAIREYNASVYCFRADWLWENLEKIPLSSKGEYYLTDLVGIATSSGLPVKGMILEDEKELIGINTRVHLAEAECALQQRINRRWMLEGVTLINPSSTFIEPEVIIGRDTVIWPGSYLLGSTQIGEACTIGPNAFLRNTRVGNGCKVPVSVLEDVSLEDHVEIEPFSRL